ncbi:MAG: (d)CMP kinase [Armatimonadaceae bacterium]
MSKPWTVAIDGPAGAGKSTVARLLAQRLEYLYIDSGAMYRAVALYALRNDVSEEQSDEIAALARSVRIEFQMGEEGAPQRILLNDEDVTEEIRTPEVGKMASVVSTVPGVRAALVAQQKAMGVAGGVVMEGRDIGTVVFPNAEIKVFLTASPEERAARRHAEIVARGTTATLEEVRREQDERDERDATRPVSPLVAATDAILLESDDLAPEEVVDDILEIIEARRREA